MLGSPLQLQHLSLAMMDADASIATDVLAQLEAIHLLEGQQDERLNQLTGLHYQQAYQRLRGHLKKIIPYLNKPLSPDLHTEMVSIHTLQRANQNIETLWKLLSTHEEQIRALKEQRQHDYKLIKSLTQFQNLNIDLGRLSVESRFLKFFVGTIPYTDYNPLQRALSLTNTMIEPFQKGDEHLYLSVATEKRYQQDVEEILKAANFHQLSIPQELYDYPDQLNHKIQQQLNQLQQKIDHHHSAIELLIEDNQDKIREARAILQKSSPFASAAGNLSGRGQLTLLQGWVPTQRVEEIEQQLQSRLEYPYLLTLRDPEADEIPEVPSLQQHLRLLQPFQHLVNQFGIPHYREIDPTTLFALSYTLMFGMMFGDVGHGAAIIFMGFLFRKRFSGLLTFATFTGLSSMMFGFLYGSLFGNEHIIQPLWMSPMEDPTLMLLIALGWGVGFLLISNLLSIINLWSLNNRRAALYSGRGVAGLLFFVSGIYVVFQLMTEQPLSYWEVTLLLLPLAISLYHNWQINEGSTLEKGLITLIEGIDTIINNLSATLSFLRVAAFSLNHVALAMAVFTLAGMMDNVGHNITLVLGNLFIIILEGGIVAIQCLRLEYYEGFARYFSGKGTHFKPLKMEVS